MSHPSISSKRSSAYDDDASSIASSTYSTMMPRTTKPFDEKRWRLSVLRNQFKTMDDVKTLFELYINKINHGYFSMFLIIEFLVNLTQFGVIIGYYFQNRSPGDEIDNVIIDLVLYFTLAVLSGAGILFIDKIVRAYSKEWHTLCYIAFGMVFFTNFFIPFIHYIINKTALRTTYSAHLIIASYVFITINSGSKSIICGVAVLFMNVICLTVVSYHEKDMLWQRILSDVIYMVSINALGIYFQYMNEIVKRRSFLDRKDCTLTKFHLQYEKQQLDQLMASIIPDQILSKVKQNYQHLHRGTKTTETFSLEKYENVTILFADIVNYTVMTTELSIDQLLETLNELFCRFDDFSEARNVTRVKFLGDCYYCVAGLEASRSTADSTSIKKTNSIDNHIEKSNSEIIVPENHAEACVDLGLDMIATIRKVRAKRGLKVNMRIGIHTGNILGGVIGSVKYQFDIWSETVDIANKMESEGEPGMVHITNVTKDLLKKEYEIKEHYKGETVPQFKKHNLKTYLITSIKTQQDPKRPSLKILMENQDIKGSIEKLERCVQTPKPEVVRSKSLDLDDIKSTDPHLSNLEKQQPEKKMEKVIENQHPVSIIEIDQEEYKEKEFEPKTDSYKRSGTFLDDMMRESDEEDKYDNETIPEEDEYDPNSISIRINDNTEDNKVNFMQSLNENENGTTNLDEVPNHTKPSGVQFSTDSLKKRSSNAPRSSVYKRRNTYQIRKFNNSMEHISEEVRPSMSRRYSASITHRRDDYPEARTSDFFLRRTAFMTSNYNKFMEMTRHGNAEIKSSIAELSFSKFSQYFKDKDINSFPFLYFISKKREAEYMKLADPLFKYYLLSQLVLLICVYIMQNLTLDEWQLFTLPFVLSLCLICAMLPFAWFGYFWNNIPNHESREAPKNRFLLFLYKSSIVIQNSIIVRLVIYTIVCGSFIYYMLTEIIECRDVSENKKHISILSLISNSIINDSFDDDTPHCIIPWHLTETFSMAIIMTFLFLRVLLIVKLLSASILTILYSYLLFGFSTDFFTESETTNLFLPSKIAQINAIVFLTLILHLIDRQTDYMHRRDFLWSQELFKNEKQAKEFKEANKNLLHNILPKHVAKKYLDLSESKDDLYHEYHENVAVMFASLVVGESLKKLSDEDYLAALNRYICDYDNLLSKDYTNIEKIKLAKWTYMAACGLNSKKPHKNDKYKIKSNQSNLSTMLEFAADMMKATKRANNNIHEVKLRIGIHEGPLMAGVVGSKKPLYDIWGDPVNVASRMDSTGVEDSIQITCEMKDRCVYKCKRRGITPVKGKGDIETYFVELDENLNLIKVKDSVPSIFE